MRGNPGIAEAGKATRWKPGEAPKGGRPKGLRDKLSQDVIAALSEVFAEGGLDAFRKVRAEDPATFLRAMIALQPKQTEEKPAPALGEFTDEELDQKIREHHEELARRKAEAGGEN